MVIVVAAGALKTHTQQSLDHVSTQMETQVKKINYEGTSAVAPVSGDTGNVGG
ncbi:MAG: hypothetical protein NT033_07455 [Candidatus Omnitrophica bacterium]|nr:hypothetical protein [Candidatus Omnitrophota bacterium]